MEEKIEKTEIKTEKLDSIKQEESKLDEQIELLEHEKNLRAKKEKLEELQREEQEKKENDKMLLNRDTTNINNKELLEVSDEYLDSLSNDEFLRLIDDAQYRLGFRLDEYGNPFYEKHSNNVSAKEVDKYYRQDIEIHKIK